MDGEKSVQTAYRIERMRPKVLERMHCAADDIAMALNTVKCLQNCDPDYRYRIVRVTTTHESEVVWQSGDSENGEG